MIHDDLQDAASRQPFEPFRVVLTIGAAYEIRQPDLIMVRKRAVVIGVTNEPTGAAFDRTIKMNLIHVVAIEELQAKTPSTNG